MIKMKAHLIPEHPRPVRGRVALVGDAAGYMIKCSGEGIYFVVKNGRMCSKFIGMAVFLNTINIVHFALLCRFFKDSICSHHIVCTGYNKSALKIQRNSNS